MAIPGLLDLRELVIAQRAQIDVRDFRPDRRREWRNRQRHVPTSGIMKRSDD
jgi:hypothetical protein